MKRLVTFVLAVALLVAVTVWLADRPGEVTIRWQGWRVDTTVPVLALVMLVIVSALHLTHRLVRGVVTAPRRVMAGRRQKRVAAGYRALSDGLAAVAAGNRSQAAKLAHKADRLLADRSLTGLLSARAAELAGDQGEAGRRFNDMLARPETAFLGLKGLLELALKNGDREAALDYARRAWSLQPGAWQLAETLFGLQARAGQWAEAELTLEEARRRKSMPADELRRRRAVVLAARARTALDAGQPADAAALALKAQDCDRTLVPAAVLAAEALHRQGKDRKAAGALESTFAAAPHPDLIAAWIALGPAETPLQRVKRMERLFKSNPGSADAHLALGEAALAARLWGQARTHLEAAERLRPSARVYRLLAQVERDDRKDEAAAASWAAKALTAAPDPAWTCRACATRAEIWAPVCPGCGGVGTMEGSV